MVRSYVTSAFAGALMLGLTTAALAATGEFDNMCTEGLALGKDINTDCSVNTEHWWQDLLLRQQGGQDRVYEGPQRQHGEGAGVLLKEASRLSLGLR